MKKTTRDSAFDKNKSRNPRKRKHTNENYLENLEKIARLVEHESAIIRIGKNGVTQTILSDIKDLIVKKKAVKVKILQNAAIEDSNSLFKKIETDVGYQLWRIKGNTGIFIQKKIEND